MTPTMPDTLGGSTYTFGITSVSASSVNYFLYSELVSKPIPFQPASAQVRFKTNDPGLKYFLQFGEGSIFGVAPDRLFNLVKSRADRLEIAYLSKTVQYRPSGGRRPGIASPEIPSNRPRFFRLVLLVHAGAPWGTIR